MSKFKVEFTLKQHTPIIHFQSEQSGATLRATELKPKFDKFLIKYAFENKEKYSTYLIDKDKDAFDYKITIEQNISKSESIKDRDPLFFGNMGDGEDKEFKTNNSTFKIIFFSFKIELLDLIKNNFESFIANTNFGTRQSKGYGSFYLNKDYEKSLVKHKCYKFTSNPNKYKEDIKILYSFMRQGINLPNREGTRFYSKPSIFLYMKNQNITWDKKAIKEKYFSTRLNEQKIKHIEADNCVNYSTNNKHLVRDLFGLSSEQEWYTYRKARILKENKEIDRFKSPITFKPILSGDKKNIEVYFWADDTIEKILNKEFLIKVDKKGDLKLSTPNKFNFDDFFNFTFNINLSKHIQSEYHNQSEYTTLSRIFNEIRGNK